MSRYMSGQFLIVDRRSYGYDLLVSVISPQYGRINLIAKNAASPKSRRNALLNTGYVINSRIYYRYHYYVSDIQVKYSFYKLRQDLETIVYFYYILKILKYYFTDETGLFIKLIKTLNYIANFENSDKKRTYLFALLVYLLEFFYIVPNGFRCVRCSKRIVKGCICGEQVFCTSHCPDIKHCLKFDLSSFNGRKDFVEQLLVDHAGAEIFTL